MRKVKILLIVLFVANHFSHATTENYEEQFPDEKEKESIDNFIAGETKSFLDKLNKERVKDNKEEITMEQIKDDKGVNKEKEILIDILNNFSKKLKEQNEKRRDKIENIEIDKKKYCYKLKIKAEKGIMFTSDTHAEADKVEKIWYFFDQLKQKNEADKLVFLGDYGDRGKYWTYTYFLLAAMAEKYGEDIIFIRGNHEDIYTMCGNGGIYAFYAMDENGEYANNCWDEMPLICEITWNQKKIFCSHGAMPLNKKGEWKKSEIGMLNRKYFLANWNENIFTEDLKQKIQPSYYRGSGYEIPIKKIFDNMEDKGYDWSIHGHVHKNQCGILKNKNKRVVTIVANEGYYNTRPDSPFLPAVYIINDENPNGIFFNLLQKQNEKIEELNTEKTKNMKVLNNCVIYEYDFEEEMKVDLQKQNEKIHAKSKYNFKGKNKFKTLLKTICCCCNFW